MAASGYPDGWHDYVRGHFRSTAGFVVAQSGDCLEIQDQEAKGPRTRVPGRDFHAMPLERGAALDLRRSWFMGVILCPGDPLDRLLQWIATLSRADQERIVLYVHPEFDQESGGVALREAGLEHIRATVFEGSWGAFHRLYGNDFSWQVWNDRP